MKLVHQYDRWRGSTVQSEQSKRLQLAGPPYNAEAGSFSFLLTPELRDGGIYSCEVCLNDNFFSQRTTLSVLKGRDESQEVEALVGGGLRGVKQGEGMDLYKKCWFNIIYFCVT